MHALVDSDGRASAAANAFRRRAGSGPRTPASQTVAAMLFVRQLVYTESTYSRPVVATVISIGFGSPQ